MALNFTER